MALVTCPHCQKKLKAPDAATPRALRCPACKKVFEYGGEAVRASSGKQTVDGRSSAFVNALVGAGAATAGAASTLGEDSAGFGGASQSAILSDADEAMLREFGSGSGLLELTREAYTSTPGDVNARAGAAPAAGDGESSSPALERQFAVVGMALTMANKLVLAHKGELARMRSAQRIAWAAMIVLAVLLAGVAWWGMGLRKDVDIAARDLETARLNAGTMQQSLEAERTRNQGLETDRTQAQKEAATASNSLARMEGSSEALKAELATARKQAEAAATDAARSSMQIEQLNKDLAKAREELQAANTQAATLRAELDALKTATQPR